jgi:integrase
MLVILIILQRRHRYGGQATGEPLSAVAVWRIMQAYAEQVELSHIKPHNVRRFVGMQLAKQDIRKAQKALGHKRIDTTTHSNRRAGARAHQWSARGSALRRHAQTNWLNPKKGVKEQIRTKKVISALPR